MKPIPDRQDPTQWEPTWRPGLDWKFKVGDVFRLDTTESESGSVYRISTLETKPGREYEIPLERQNDHCTGWLGGFAWDFARPSTRIKLWLWNENESIVVVNDPAWKAWAHNIPGECPCGILRTACEYHR